MIRYCESFRYCCKALSTHVSNDLTHVSVPAKYIKHALKVSSTFVPTHAPSGSALVCPIMPIMDQYFCDPLQVQQAKRNIQNLHKQQKRHLKH
jgi:hypothetical protein